MNVINVDNQQQTLYHQGNLMNTIRYALRNYLTKYFVVDSNLLDILGNIEETDCVISQSIE